MNINVHLKSEFWNLGLARIVGTCPAEKCIEIIKQKLATFGLDFESDIVCITTDGASVMKKVDYHIM